MYKYPAIRIILLQKRERFILFHIFRAIVEIINKIRFRTVSNFKKNQDGKRLCFFRFVK
jgi:hypothetical protein